MARIQTEHGGRNVQVDEYKGKKIEVATGYDARSDRWPVHVYIDGQKVSGQASADNMSEAFDYGFALAQREIEQQ
ncbi:hypothetical protein [Paraburkholderia tropica]|uniref:hypothetical protein n=1 Tax=Paraburkholderia tropica TaxID=92647 RepID=UPI002AB730B3|nr:hypothetical protein [Paraburkholderia tropica]